MCGLAGRQVRVTIIQAQQLAGLDIDPVIRVDIGPESRYTSISKSTNCPYYNEFYVFDFHEPTAMILDKIITISVNTSHASHLSVSLARWLCFLDVYRVVQKSEATTFEGSDLCMPTSLKCPNKFK